MRRLKRAFGIAAVLGVVAIVVAIAALALRPEFALELEFARQRWLAGAQQDAIDVDGSRVVYLEAGRGAPVVLLHGFTGSKENWLALMPELRARHRLIAPDLPGWGESTRDAEADYGYGAQAERIAALLAALQLERVTLVGHSMGGGIAALVAARHPERIERLVLMDAGGALFRENAFGRAVLRGENPFAVSDGESLARYLDAVFDAPPPVPWPADRALIARRVRDAAFESRVLDAVGRGPEAFLPAEEAARIAQPTLLLWCRDDRVIDASAADAYAAAIPHSTTVLLDACNHMPMMEQPRATAAALEEFLR